jgi:hypothetical protein
VLGALGARVRQLAPAQLSDIIWALAELGLSPGEELLQRFDEEAAGKLLALTPPARLARAVVTLVRLGRAPDSAALLLAMDDLQPAALPAGALGELLWALARMRFRPGGMWVDQAAACILAAATSGTSTTDGATATSSSNSSGRGGADGAAQLTPHHWARSLEGFAGIGARLPPDWVLSAAQATRGMMGVLTGQQLLACSRALAALAPGAAGEVAGILGFAAGSPAAAPLRGKEGVEEGAVVSAAAAAAAEQEEEEGEEPPAQPPGAGNRGLAPRPVLKRPVLRKHAAR